jgi:isopenicillin-N epimerase
MGVTGTRGMANFGKLDAAVRAAAADYTGGKPEEIALTGNTTTGLALLYGAMPLRPRQEIVVTTHDHYVTYEALRLRALHTGAAVRKIPLYAAPEKATASPTRGRGTRASFRPSSGRRSSCG